MLLDMGKDNYKIYTYEWFLNQFENARDQARQLVPGVDEDLFLRRPAPGKWSAAECLGHLVEFGNIYYNVIEKAIEQASGNTASSQAVFTPRLPWRWVIRFFEPPYKMKLKTISSFKPRDDVSQSAQQIYNSFSALQERFISQIEKSRQESIDLSATKVRHPVLSFLKMTLSECYALTEAHQRRHLWQAEQTIKKLETI